MSSRLACRLYCESDFPPAYWWPLVFETMRRLGFGFDNPFFLPERKGTYIGVGDEEDAVISRDDATFRELWNVAYTHQGSLTVEFWGQSEKDDLLTGAVRRRDRDVIEIELGLPSESLDDESREGLPSALVERRLRRWLDGVIEIYRFCSPCTGEIGWERWGEVYIVGTIGKAGAMDKPQLEMDTQQWHVPHTSVPSFEIVHRALEADVTLDLLNPFPIPWRGTWAFLTLPW